MRIVERVAYAARIAAKTFWDEQFQVVTQVDKDGIPTGTTGSPTVTTNAAIGTTADAPLAGETAEDGTARTGISLWKRAVNQLIAIKLAAAAVLGVNTDAPLAGFVTPEDGTARSGISLWKRTVNMLIGAYAWLQSLVQKQNLSGNDMYCAVGTRTGDTAFTFTPPAPIATATVTPIDVRAIFCRSTVAGSVGLWYEVPMSQLSISAAPAPFTVTVSGAAFPATCEIKIFFRNEVRAFNTASSNYNTVESQPLHQKYSGPTAIGAQQTFTAAYADWGGEISCLGYKNIGLYIDKTIGTSTGLKLQILVKHTNAAADEYVLETDIALGDATGYIFLPRSTLMNTAGYIQLQIKDDAGGTGTVNAGSRYIVSY